MTLPLGLSLNNPGNIRPGSDEWRGQIGVKSGFVVFDTMANGIRALAKNLIAYYDRSAPGPNRRYTSVDGTQIDTVREAIYRWAPPGDHNDTEAYIAAVCHDLGCDENDVFDFHDPNFLFWMIAAIGHQEQGAAFTLMVNDADINAGVASALA